MIHGLLITVLITAVWRVVQLHQQLGQSTLLTAARWAIAAAMCWLAAALISWGPWSLPSEFTDQFWYWTAVVSLCPPMAVLGARRPTVRVWSWFILIPLIAVLGWPAMTLWAGLPVWRPIQIEAPVLIGFFLVLVMGCGNFLGTRFTTSALFFVLAITLLLLPFATLSASWTWVQFNREGAVAMLAAAIWLASYQSARPTSAPTRFDALWWDFRDAFGIVWSMRVQEQLLDAARREHWCVSLGTEGFLWDAKATPEQRQQTEQQLEHALRWSLRRFVDPPWIDARLQSDPTQQEPCPVPTAAGS